MQTADSVRLAKLLVKKLGLPPGPLSLTLSLGASGQMPTVTCTYPLFLEESEDLTQEFKKWRLVPVKE